MTKSLALALLVAASVSAQTRTQTATGGDKTCAADYIVTQCLQSESNKVTRNNPAPPPHFPGPQPTSETPKARRLLRHRLPVPGLRAPSRRNVRFPPLPAPPFCPFVLTAPAPSSCYNNCPDDTRAPQATQNMKGACLNASLYATTPSRTASAAASAKSSTTAAAAATTEAAASTTVATGSATSTADRATKTNAAGSLAGNAAGMLAAVAGVVVAAL